MTTKGHTRIWSSPRKSILGHLVNSLPSVICAQVKSIPFGIDFYVRQRISFRIDSYVRQRGPEGSPSSLPHDEYGNFYFFVHYAIGNTAQDRNCQSAPPMRTYNNQIYLRPCSLFHNTLTGCPAVITVFDWTPFLSQRFFISPAYPSAASLR